MSDLVLFILEPRKTGCHLGVARDWGLAGLASLSQVTPWDDLLGLWDNPSGGHLCPGT